MLYQTEGGTGGRELSGEGTSGHTLSFACFRTHGAEVPDVVVAKLCEQLAYVTIGIVGGITDKHQDGVRRGDLDRRLRKQMLVPSLGGGRIGLGDGNA